jgi:hypothetical protein
MDQVSLAGGARQKLLVQGSLNRLVGIAGQASIHLAELGDLGDVGVIRLLRILGLNLDGLLYRLCADELFEGTRAILERLLGIISDLGRMAWKPLFISPNDLTAASEPSLPLSETLQTFEHHEPSLEKYRSCVARPYICIAQ